MNTFKLTLLFGLLVFGIAGAANADSVTLTLTNPEQSGSPGATLNYVATVLAPATNTAPIFLVGDSATFAASFSLDDSPFLSFPLSLNPGQSSTGLLFDIPIPVNAPFGTFSGTFEITGGATASSMALIGSAPFAATVTPEPAAIVLFGIGLSCVFLSVWRAAVVYSRLGIARTKIKNAGEYFQSACEGPASCRSLVRID